MDWMWRRKGSAYRTKTSKISLLFVLLFFALLIMTGCSKEESNSTNTIANQITETTQGTKTNEDKEDNVKLETTTYKINDVEFKMIYVQAGTFTMGSNDKDVRFSESPAHQVTLTKDYLMNIHRTPVTSVMSQVDLCNIQVISL
ncbi:MAG: SUMF1/EgtB/PvdO family nonheme iron enzyme [Erysipelotrichaceae bacterium]|nr:SUMF1/EgtB/PvdO family nonheme iron enzyme [Erysipelotrichaceae bacterium]